MRLEPGDDQIALVDAVKAVLDDVVTPQSRRARRDGGSIDRAAWTTLGELGLYGLVVPEGAGGLGLGTVELALVLEVVGRSGFAAPVLETAAVVAPLLATLQDDRADLLDDVLLGRAVATATLSPTSRVAGDAMEADVIAWLGDPLRVDEAEKFHRRPQQSFDTTRRPCAIEVGDARCVDLDPDALDRLHSRVLVANSALLLGIATELFEQTVRYTADRRQFGRPIASFQAVKHRLADTHVELEASRAAIWSAAIELDEAPSRSSTTAAHVAAAMVGEAAELANDSALQLHGGIGYTWEHDLQLWLKQGLAVGRRLGRPAHHRRRALELATSGSIFRPSVEVTS